MNQNVKSGRFANCGTIFLVVACGMGIMAAIGFGVLWGVFGPEPEGLTIVAQVTPLVNVQQEFQITVQLGNTGSKPLTVTQIKLPRALLENAVVTGVDPSSSGQRDETSATAYGFSLALEAGENRTVTFILTALTPGDISGTVSVVVGLRSKQDDLRVVITNEVADQPTPAATLMIAADSQSTAIPAGLAIPYQAVVEITAIVEVNGSDLRGWSGSGTIISPDGLILTNAHVVLSDRYYQVKRLEVGLTTTPEQPPEFKYYAEPLQVDAGLDLAVLRITTDMNGNPVDPGQLNLPTVPMGDSDLLQLGDGLTILGYPGIGGETITLTDGKVSGFTSESGLGNRAFIKTSATIAGGNSGGLAANQQGELVGVPTQVGYGGQGDVVDCRPLADTNGDGVIDNRDSCVPTGGFINALRPINLAKQLIDAARRGEVNISPGISGQAGYQPSGEVLFSDDFSNPQSGWDNNLLQHGGVGYNENEYWIRVDRPKYFIFSTVEVSAADAVITVEARMQAATGSGDYGVICHALDGDNFYALEITEDGYFAIWMQQNGQAVALYDWTYSDSIPSRQAVKITAACSGNNLSLAVNDILLAEVTDYTFGSGRVGLLAGTMDTSGLIVAFDNFVVRKP